MLGDDDLLTLIGQSKDISRATGHLQKIFIGVSGLTVNKNIITAIKSPDNEEFQLNDFKVDIRNKAFTEWIKNVETSMQQSIKEQTFAIFGLISNLDIGDVSYIDIAEKNSLQP